MLSVVSMVFTPHFSLVGRKNRIRQLVPKQKSIFSLLSISPSQSLGGKRKAGEKGFFFRPSWRNIYFEKCRWFVYFCGAKKIAINAPRAKSEFFWTRKVLIVEALAEAIKTFREQKTLCPRCIHCF